MSIYDATFLDYTHVTEESFFSLRNI